MTSSPITSWQIDGETMETLTDFIFSGSKITANDGCSHEVKRCLLLGRKAMTNLAAAAAKSLQSCPTLCDPIDGSPPGSPIPGILQARVLEWVVISFSDAWKWKVKVKLLSYVRLLATPWTAAYQAPLSMGFARLEYYLDSILKSRDITLLTKVCLVKAVVFPVVMYGCESWTIKLSTEEMMLLSCGIEDSWDSLGLQGDPTSQS